MTATLFAIDDCIETAAIDLDLGYPIADIVSKLNNIGSRTRSGQHWTAAKLKDHICRHNKHTPLPRSRLPIEPLIRFVLAQGSYGWNEPGAAQYAANRLGVSRDTLSNWTVGRRPTVSLDQADKLALRAGTHPINIWGDAWANPPGTVTAQNEDATYG